MGWRQRNVCFTMKSGQEERALTRLVTIIPQMMGVLQQCRCTFSDSPLLLPDAKGYSLDYLLFLEPLWLSLVEKLFVRGLQQYFQGHGRQLSAMPFLLTCWACDCETSCNYFCSSQQLFPTHQIWFDCIKSSTNQRFVSSSK